VERRVTIGPARVALFGLLTLAGLPWSESGQAPATTHRIGEHRVAFYAQDGAVFVRGRVNGNRTTLLIDTGAVVTTFTSKLVPGQGTGSKITMNTAKGTVEAFRLPVEFTLGESELRDASCSFRQDAIVGDFKFGAADGVVGIDVLSSFKSVTIDFRNSVLILKDK
jgi:predicted aspartyl protease